MNKALLTRIAALFLATGAVHAQSNYTGRSIFGSTPSQPLRRRYSAPFAIDHLRAQT